MASKRIENTHTRMLKQLMSESGLVCIRPAPESLSSETETEETEEGHAEEEEEIESEVPREEQKQTVEEEISEELPTVFPTPSLRKVLPDRIRKIEEHNRIHVLPEEFKTEIDPQAIPSIANTAQQKYIDILAGLVGCESYKSSLAEYWFLDTLANLLRRAQEDELSQSTQVVLIHWFCEWMKEMQNFDAADRQRMLRRFQDNMLSAAQCIGEERRLPTPDDAGVYFKAPDDNLQVTVASPDPSVLDKHQSVMSRQSQSTTKRYSVAVRESMAVTFQRTAYECALQDLTKIIHYVYDLFSTDYQYDLVRSIFTFSPEYTLIDAPYQLQVPKRMYAPIKYKAKREKSAKKDTKGKKKKGEPEPTEEYLALMALKAFDEREREEQEERDREAWHRKSHILPLTMAATDELFARYWPPPTPEPEPELPPPEMKKGKKGKK